MASGGQGKGRAEAARERRSCGRVCGVWRWCACVRACVFVRARVRVCAFSLRRVRAALSSAMAASLRLRMDHTARARACGERQREMGGRRGGAEGASFYCFYTMKYV